MRVVLVTEVTRTWPRLVPLRTKLTTGKPKPRLAKPLPVIVKLAGGEARSTGLGVMELTPGGGRVSLTVSEVLPTRLQLLCPCPRLVIDIYCHRAGAQSRQRSEDAVEWWERER